MLARAVLSLLAAALCGRCASSNAVAPDAPARAEAPSEARYLALGDSFTIGTGSSAAQAFPSRLAARWSAPRCRVTLRNPAVNGFTTQDLIDRELPELRAFAPTWVSLAVGANDLVRGSDVARYRAQLARIFDAIAAAGVPASRVLVIPQPDWAHTPTGRSFGEPEAVFARIVAFNDALRALATERGARYVDLFPRMREQARAGQVAPDGLHPDARAHDAWAEALAREVPTPCS
ncbi:MAG: SGNH/GDSL hydrolase family protein [Polyangiales bacterium]